MPQTVVGLFQNTIEAQKIKHELVNQGYSADNIRVIAKDQAAGESGTSSSGTAVTEMGWGATISNFFRSLTGGGEDEQHYAEGIRQGGAILSVTVPEGQETKAADLLERYGAQDVNDRQAGMSSAASADVSPSGTHEVSGDTMIPIVQEEMTVGKRQVQRGGVRVYSHLVAMPVEENIQLREEHIHVDRRSMDRLATEADFSTFQEGTMEFNETAEEAVVAKKARVVEEIVIGKETTERTETIRDTVRHTEIETEQLDANPSRSSSPSSDHVRDSASFKASH